MNRHPDVKLLASQLVHRGRVFDVVQESLQLPSGLRQDLTLIEHPGAVGVVALFDDASVLLVRQYRHAIGEWLLEIPAGRLEPGEDEQQGAARELEEETGHRAARWRRLKVFYPAPGFCSEVITLFVAEGLTPVAKERRAADDDEEFELVRLSLADARAAVARDAKSWIALTELWIERTRAGPRPG